MSEYIISEDEYNFILNYSRKADEIEKMNSISKWLARNQIVRCRDCEWWQPQSETYPPTCVGLGGMWGQSYNEDGNGYCAWGERRHDA